MANTVYLHTTSQLGTIIGDRARKLVTIIGDQMFQSDEEPFKIQKNHDKKKDMITTLDLAFLTLFSLYMLIEDAGSITYF